MTTPLKNMVDLVMSPDGLTELEMEKDLKAMGVDVKASKASIRSTIEAGRAALKRQRLDEARAQREIDGRRQHGILESLKQLKLPFDVLVARIQGMEGSVAHRELQGMSREDLESELADMLALQQERGEE